jgi:hypothetical protein
MISVRRLDPGALAVGSRARVIQPKLRPAIWQVTELQENRNFTWVSAMPGLRMTAAHMIEPQDERTLIVLSFVFSGLLSRVVARFYGTLIEQYLTIEAQGLKQRSESLGIEG